MSPRMSSPETGILDEEDYSRAENLDLPGTEARRSVSIPNTQNRLGSFASTQGFAEGKQKEE